MRARGWAIAVVLPVLLAGCASTGGTHATRPAAAQAPASAAAAALSPAQARFVSGFSAALGDQGLSDAAEVKMGETVCTARQGGASASTIIDATTNRGPARVLVKTAEKYLCPQYLPHKATVVIRFAGSGIRNSAPFLITGATVMVRYTYDCADAGGSGNFIADMESGNQSSPGSDDQSIANALGSGGSQTTTLYPADVGSEYHLAVNSECSWSLVVKDG